MSYLKGYVHWEWNCWQNLNKVDKWSINQQSGPSNVAFCEPARLLPRTVLPVSSVISSGFSRTELVSLALGPIYLWGWLVLVLHTWLASIYY